MEKYILYKTKGGNPELLDIFYRNFVRPIKTRFEHNLNFINRCLDEFFHVQTTPRRETQFCVDQVKKIKLKLDLLEDIKFPRFESYCKKLGEKDYINTLKEKYKSRDTKNLAGLGNLFSAFPCYLDIRLHNLTLSRVFDKMGYSNFFFDSQSKVHLSLTGRENR
jgi:hypothetical protein